MKRLSLILVSVAIAVPGFFTSCSKEDDPDGPQITFSNNLTEITLDKGVTSWEINATITSVAGLDEVKIFQVSTAGEDQIGQAVTSFPDKNSYDLKVTISGVVEQTTIKVNATDKNGTTNARNFVIKVTPDDPPPAEDKLIFYTGTLAAQLGAQSNATTGSSFASTTGAVYLQSAAKTNAGKVDFIYYYNNSDESVKAEIISPKFAADNGNVLNANTWSVKNDTKFKDVSSTVSADQFDAIVITDDAPVTEAATNLTEQRVKDLAVGDVFAFETAGGKKGLAKVKALSGTTAGTITIEVKVQR